MNLSTLKVVSSLLNDESNFLTSVLAFYFILYLIYSSIGSIQNISGYGLFSLALPFYSSGLNSEFNSLRVWVLFSNSAVNSFLILKSLFYLMLSLMIDLFFQRYSRSFTHWCSNNSGSSLALILAWKLANWSLILWSIESGIYVICSNCFVNAVNKVLFGFTSLNPLSFRLCYYITFWMSSM